MEINEIACKSIMSNSGIYGVDYSINPYTGCEHGCKYCYATFMTQYTDHDESWGNFVDVKENAKEILEKDLRKKRKGSILLSSVTDPYQPAEENYRITRKILKRLANSKFSVNILTKSDLILRDLDILNDFNKNRICVGFTINFLNEKDREIWEPSAPRIQDRLSALEELSKSGIDCYVHIGPYFESITKLEEILKRTEGFIEELQIEDINWRSKKRIIMETIDKNYPSLRKNYESISKNKSSYKWRLENEVEELREKTRVPITLFLD